MIQYYEQDSRKRWPLLSQHPEIASPWYKKRAEAAYLPVLMRVWQVIEAVTGHKWMCTSYWRDSPSHRRGEAIDLAPDIAPSVAHMYAVTRGSDPVLYKRVAMIRQLQEVARLLTGTLPYSVGIYIEPDHLHVQLVKPLPSPEVRIFKWKQPKPVYADTMSRMALPLFT